MIELLESGIQGKRIMSTSSHFTQLIEKISNSPSLLRIALTTDSDAYSLEHYCWFPGNLDAFTLVWDITSGKCLQIWSGHYGSVKSVAYHPNSHILASSSQDETIRLWNIQTGKGIQILRSPRLYEGMNITGVTGLTEAQIANLKALGAVEFQES